MEVGVDNLPEGYFFDGRLYIDQYGVSRAEHRKYINITHVLFLIFF